jgi:RNA polymerase sigma-70 factor (ECF subfamily)
MTGDARTDDAALAGRVAAGDLSAFEELYRVHASRLFNLAFRMLGNPADAEDALQEVFLQAFRKIGSFKGDAAIGTWLYRMAMNLCLDRLRSRSVRDARHTESLDAPGLVRPVAAANRERVLSRLELERAIARLPEGARAAFVLHDVEGFDHREVGEILGVSEGTSKSQVHKARMKLREWLMA